MEWTRGPIIGRGSSASVSLSTTVDGELFAVKSTELSSSPLLQTEQFLISQLSSPYIVKCLGSDITYEKNKQVYNLFLEYVPGGSLSDLIKKQGSSLNENAIQFYTNQILLGLNYLHLNRIVHCDIKGQNLLIGKEGLKIADFGCAKLAESKSEFAGTPGYMSPEVARQEEQSFPADIWAMGCTIIEMATGTNPWPEMKDPVSALYRIGYSGEVPEIPRWFSDDAKDFVNKCLMKDPKERWTAAELLRHPFVSSVKEYCLEVKEFTRKLSPTTVMDRGFWDDLEVSDTSRDPTVVIASCSDSPASRLRGLFGDDILEFPDWTEEEGWVNVRCNEIEECEKVVELNCDMIQDCEELMDVEAFEFLSVDEEEEIRTLINIEDSLFDCYIDEISIIAHISAVLISENVEDVYVTSAKNVNGTMFSSRSTFYLAPFLFLALFIYASQLYIIKSLFKISVFSPFLIEGVI